MSQDQIQQLITQQMQQYAAATPLWMKALFVLQVLSLIVTVVCLPLIVWKLFSCNKARAGTSVSPAEQSRLQQIRDRREVLQKLSGTSHHAAEPPNHEADSRFQPPS